MRLESFCEWFCPGLSVYLLLKQHDSRRNIFEQIYLMQDEHNGHIQSDHLLQMVGRVGSLLDKDVKPRVPGVKSLLGGARQSLLRKSGGNLPSAIVYEWILRIVICNLEYRLLTKC